MYRDVLNYLQSLFTGMHKWNHHLHSSSLVQHFINPSAHAREGYNSHFVCLSVCHFLILEKAPFSVETYILGDDLSPLRP